MVFEKVCALITDQFGVSENVITMKTLFVEDLNADSLDIVELIMAVEEEFDISEIEDNTLENIKTVGDVVNFIKDKLER